MPFAKRILIVGASGFLGNQLITAFSGQPFEIIAISKSRYEGICPQNVVWHNMNIATDQRFDNIEFESFDFIIHMATVFPCLSRPRLNLFAVNTCSVLKILDRLIDQKAEHKTTLIFFSAMSIFKTFSQPYITPYSPPCPKSEYDRSKFAAETCLSSWSNSVIVRIPLLLEPGASRSWLTDAFKKFQTDQPVSITNGNALYNHIIDFSSILSLIYLIIDCGTEFVHSISLPINLGSSDPIEIIEIMHLMKAQLSSNSPIIDLTSSTNTQTVPIISLELAHHLGVFPKTTTEIVADFVSRSV